MAGQHDPPARVGDRESPPAVLWQKLPRSLPREDWQWRATSRRTSVGSLAHSWEDSEQANARLALLCYLGARASRPPPFSSTGDLLHDPGLAGGCGARAGGTPALPGNKGMLA